MRSDWTTREKTGGVICMRALVLGCSFLLAQDRELIEDGMWNVGVAVMCDRVCTDGLNVSQVEERDDDDDDEYQNSVTQLGSGNHPQFPHFFELCCLQQAEFAFEGTTQRRSSMVFEWVGG